MHHGIEEKINVFKKNIRNIRLVIVTKSYSAGILAELCALPYTIEIGENKWQDFEKRFLHTKLYEDLKEKGTIFHFIGHLQTNKVKHIVQYFDLIQSVDSVKLLTTIDASAKAQNKIQKVLIQINIWNDESKTGCTLEKAVELIKISKTLKNIEPCGVMGMIDMNEEPVKVEMGYQKIAQFAKKNALNIVSTGTSKDYKIAIANGSTMVRIGRALL